MLNWKRQPSPTKISIKIDDKTIQKVRKILEEIGRDERINNAVAAFDAIEEQAEKYQLKNLLALEIFWRSIWQFMVNFGDTSKEVFLSYVGKQLNLEFRL
ncbi:hypothetical protein [Candidatus Marithrix sp. Canyon 246]|uniref:hypothetical protein n=1 Tax=Candidatus Marithrix sp. Canyon 246 TaxID=1827136 RepID=UPI00084A0510|nr:hypothetical protein [Candidatus Marithrix sp. Canyon 246]